MIRRSGLACCEVQCVKFTFSKNVLGFTPTLSHLKKASNVNEKKKSLKAQTSLNPSVSVGSKRQSKNLFSQRPFQALIISDTSHGDVLIRLRLHCLDRYEA